MSRGDLWVVCVVAGVFLWICTAVIGAAVGELTKEVQATRRLLATNEEHSAWKSYPHMAARLLEEIHGDVRELHRMLGHEYSDRRMKEWAANFDRLLEKYRPDVPPEPSPADQPS
jgi:hypothetical protein